MASRRRQYFAVLMFALAMTQIGVSQQNRSAAEVTVPYLSGLTTKNAKEELEQVGLVAKLELGTRATSAARALTVYAQDPENGTKVARGTTVRVTIHGKWEAATAENQPGAVAAPNGMVVAPTLTGMSTKDARAAITAAGLVPKFHIGIAPPARDRELTVYRQEPRSGATIARGETVNIYIYSRGGVAEATAPANPELVRVSAVPLIDRSTPEIDPRRGQLSYGVTDLAFQAGPIRMEVRRTLRPGLGTPGLLGGRWGLNWESRLYQTGSRAIVDEGAGRIVFTLDEKSERYLTPAGDKLVFGAALIAWSRPDGRRDIFNDQGRLVQRDDLNGNTTTLKYDDKGRISEIQGPCGSFLRFTVGPDGLLTRIESSTGAMVQYEFSSPNANVPKPDVLGDVLSVAYAYDRTGISKIAHPILGTTLFAYDEKGRVVSRTDTAGATEQFAFDDAARTVRHTDPLGQVTTITWSQDQLIEETTNPAGAKTVTVSDAAGRPLAITGPTGLTARFTYDSFGRPITIENPTAGKSQLEYFGESTLPSVIVGPGANQQTFLYDARGNLLSHKQSDDPARNATYEYYDDGKVKKLTTGDGQASTFTYDSSGRRTSVTDAAGNTSRFEYDARGNLIRETNPLGGVTVSVYDAQNRISSVTDPAGAVTKFEYQQRDGVQTIVMTDARGGVTSSTYDGRGNLLTHTDATKRTTRYDYDALGRRTRVTDSAGVTYQFQYDAANNLVGETNPLGAITRRTYDAAGKMTSVIDPAGGTTSYEYSPKGFLSRAMNAAGIPTAYVYDAQGQVASETDSNGTLQYERSPAGRILRVIPSYGQPIAYEYDPAGNLIAMNRGGQNIATYSYNQLGQRIKEKTAAGIDITYRYDALGNLVGWENTQGQRETIKNDLAGRPITTTDALGGSTSFTYDAGGNVTKSKDPLGSEKQFAYDLADQLKEVIEPNGDRARYDYDAGGRLTQVQRPAGGTSSYAYDALGNIVKTVNPVGLESRASYDPAGRLMSTTDAKGQTTSFLHDAAGRLTQKRLADGKTVGYEYDAKNNLVKVDDGAFPVLYSHDARGNVTKVEYPKIKRTLQYEYNEAGLKSRFIDSEGRTTLYEYDSADRITAIRLLPNQVFQFTYDKARLASVRFPNGIASAWEYDALNRPVKLTYTDAAGKSVAGWKYAYDAAGNRTEATTVEGNTTRYRFDAACQLLEEDSGKGQLIKYSYLAGGNRGSRDENGVKTAYRYDAADQISAAGQESFAHDANGNLVTRKGPQGTTQYVYDAENRLVKVTLPDGKEVSYGYAPTGERIWRRNSQGLTYYVTDGVNVIAELGEDLQPRASYVQSPGVDLPLSMSRGAETYFFHADQMGSIARLTDQSGKVAAAYEYDAFGQLQGRPAGISSPFTFTAREYDAATGLYYFRARYLDARLGRFLTCDPVEPDMEVTLNLNPYLYAYNAPTRYVDPMGTENESGVFSWARGHSTNDLYSAKESHNAFMQNPANKGQWHPDRLPKTVGEIEAELARRKMPQYRNAPPPTRPQPPPDFVPKPQGNTAVVRPAPAAGNTVAVKAPAAPRPPGNLLGGGKGVPVPPTAWQRVKPAVGPAAALGGGVVIINVALDRSEGKPWGQIGKELVSGIPQALAETAVAAGTGALAGAPFGGIGAIPGAIAGVTIYGGTQLVGGVWNTGKRVINKFWPSDPPPTAEPPPPPNVVEVAPDTSGEPIAESDLPPNLNSPTRKPTGNGDLTPRDLDLATDFAAGTINAEIAAREAANVARNSGSSGGDGGGGGYVDSDGTDWEAVGRGIGELINIFGGGGGGGGGQPGHH